MMSKETTKTRIPFQGIQPKGRDNKSSDRTDHQEVQAEQPDETSLPG